MNEQKKIPFGKVWLIASAILVCVVPYVGIFLAIPRVIMERRFHKREEKTMLSCAVSVLLWSMFMMALMTRMRETPGMLTLAPLFSGVPAVCGVCMLVQFLRFRRQDHLCRLTETIIFMGHVTNLNEIAEYLTMSEAQVKTFLTDMLARKHLSEFTLDETDVHPQRLWHARFYQCPDCAGEQTLNVGKDITCRYCGSPVRWEAK